jgi:hypothetical protein
MDDEEEVGNVDCEHDSEGDEGNCEDTEAERDDTVNRMRLVKLNKC